MVLNKLNVSYGELNVSYGELKKMTETELDAFIKNEKYTSNEESSFPIIVPKISEEYPKSSTKSNIMILPLSIEDESLTTCTACVMREFSQDLDIPLKKSDQYVIYSAQSGNATGFTKRWNTMTDKWKNSQSLWKKTKLKIRNQKTTAVIIYLGVTTGGQNHLMKQMSTHMKDVMTKLKDGVKDDRF